MAKRPTTSGTGNAPEAASATKSVPKGPRKPPAAAKVADTPKPVVATPPAPEAPITPPPPPTPTPIAPARIDEHEDGTPLANKVLTGLALLLAGGVLALWAGPRIAPHLPKGMAPVADWLAPGANGSAVEVAALRSEIEDRLAARPGALSPEAVAAIADASVARASRETENRIGALTDQILQNNSADIEARLTAAETALASLLTTLNALDGGTGPNADILAFSANIETLRGELAGLADQNAALQAEISTMSSTSETQVQTARASAEAAQAEAEAAQISASTRAALAELRAAAVTGRSFRRQLDAWAGATALPVPEALDTAADAGLASMGQLRAEFPDAAHDAIRASVRASAGEGVIGRSLSLMRARISGRSLTPQPGPTPDAVLSRAEDALRRDDLAGALAETDTLPSEAKAAMADWLARATVRLDALAALDEISASTGN